MAKKRKGGGIATDKQRNRSNGKKSKKDLDDESPEQNDDGDDQEQQEERQQERATREGRARTKNKKPRRRMSEDEDEEEEKSDSEAGSDQDVEEQEDRDEENDDDDDDDDVEEESGEGDDEDEDDRVVIREKLLPLPPPPSQVSDGRYRNKQRCLVVCSRGVTARYRHLLEDLRTLLPHHKKESKLDAKSDAAGKLVNDIAALRGCSTAVYLECRKRQDAYLWISRIGGGGGGGVAAGGNDDGVHAGPSARFLVTNVHTMDELKLTGNCMKGSRPVLCFDDNFGKLQHLKLLKELFVDVFGTPRGHPKSKPFVDRVMCFYYADGRIWVRNYQILEQQPSNAMEAHQLKKQHEREAAGVAVGGAVPASTSLVEIGPRFVLNPIRVFRGSFGGQTLYKNDRYVSPNEVRSIERRKKGMSYQERKHSQQSRLERESNIVLPNDPLKDVFT